MNWRMERGRRHREEDKGGRKKERDREGKSLFIQCLHIALQFQIVFSYGLFRRVSGKESAYQFRRWGFNPWIRKISWRKKWQPTPVVLPGEFLGERSLAGCSPWGCQELDMTERLSTQSFHITSRFLYFSDILLPISL